LEEFKKASDRVYPVFEEADLGCVAGFIQRMDLLVCPDGGISHLAAAVDVAALTLFFETDPQVWHHPGNQRHSIYTPEGAASLAVETVADKVSEILEAAPRH